MIPRIETLTEKKLIGKRLTMSLSTDKTFELWKSFMSRKKEITNSTNSDLYSLKVYNPLYFIDFNLQAAFEKWAAVEVASFSSIPFEMDPFNLKGGLYAVFTHQGSSLDHSTFQYIFNSWLPNSNYILDERPHFEILGEKYKNEDITSEEEIWIPISLK